MKPATTNRNSTTSRPESPAFLRAVKDGVVINVCVVPRSSQSMIVGVHENALKIKLTKPPVEGQANSECCAVIAHCLGVSKSRVRVIQGQRSRRKEILVEGIPEKDIADRFSSL